MADLKDMVDIGLIPAGSGSGEAQVAEASRDLDELFAGLVGIGCPLRDVVIGEMGSSAGGQGLAMLRLDRVVEFAAKGVGLTAGGMSIVADAGDVARLAPKVAG